MPTPIRRQRQTAAQRQATLFEAHGALTREVDKMRVVLNLIANTWTPSEAVPVLTEAGQRLLDAVQRQAFAMTEAAR